MTVSDISFYHVFCAFSGIKPVWNGQKKFNWKYWNGTKKKIQPRIRDVFFLQNKYWFCFSCPASTADKYPNVLQPLAFCPENTLYKKSLGMKKHKVFRTYRVHNHYFPIAAEDPCQISVQSLSALQLIKTPHCILSKFYNRDKQQLPVLVQHSTYLSDHVLHGRCLYGKRGAVKEKEKAWTEKWRQREREMLRVRRGSYHSLPAADCQSSSLIMSSGVYAHKIHTNTRILNTESVNKKIVLYHTCCISAYSLADARFCFQFFTFRTFSKTQMRSVFPPCRDRESFKERMRR